MNQRPLLNEQNLSSRALTAVAAFHRNIVDEVSKAVQENQIVIVGMAQNPVVKAARKTLESQSLPHKYIEYGSYFGKWKERLAIKLWSGWPTFPQVFYKGHLIGGNAELQIALKNGEIKK